MQVQDELTHRFSRLEETKKLKDSSLDIPYLIEEIKAQLHDDTVWDDMIVKAYKQLGEAKVRGYAEYAARKGKNPGRAFVALCNKAMQ